MNVDDYLDDVVQRGIAIVTRDCYRCHGNGKRLDHDNPIHHESETPEGLARTTVYPRIACEECDGLGARVATVTAPSVQNLVCGSVLGMIMRARSDGNFGTLNAALDWYERFVGQVLQNTSPEEMQAAAALMADDTPLHVKLRGKIDRIADLAHDVASQRADDLASGALTPDELRELGIDEDDTPAELEDP